MLSPLSTQLQAHATAFDNILAQIPYTHLLDEIDAWAQREFADAPPAIEEKEDDALNHILMSLSHDMEDHVGGTLVSRSIAEAMVQLATQFTTLTTPAQEMAHVVDKAQLIPIIQASVRRRKVSLESQSLQEKINGDINRAIAADDVFSIRVLMMPTLLTALMAKVDELTLLEQQKTALLIDQNIHEHLSGLLTKHLEFLDSILQEYGNTVITSALRSQINHGITTLNAIFIKDAEAAIVEPYKQLIASNRVAFDQGEQLLDVKVALLQIKDKCTAFLEDETRKEQLIRAEETYQNFGAVPFREQSKRLLDELTYTIAEESKEEESTIAQLKAAIKQTAIQHRLAMLDFIYPGHGTTRDNASTPGAWDTVLRLAQANYPHKNRDTQGNSLKHQALHRQTSCNMQTQVAHLLDLFPIDWGMNRQGQTPEQYANGMFNQEKDKTVTAIARFMPTLVSIDDIAALEVIKMWGELVKNNDPQSFNKKFQPQQPQPMLSEYIQRIGQAYEDCLAEAHQQALSHAVDELRLFLNQLNEQFEQIDIKAQIPGIMHTIEAQLTAKPWQFVIEARIKTLCCEQGLKFAQIDSSWQTLKEAIAVQYNAYKNEATAHIPSLLIQAIDTRIAELEKIERSRIDAEQKADEKQNSTAMTYDASSKNQLHWDFTTEIMKFVFEKVIGRNDLKDYHALCFPMHIDVFKSQASTCDDKLLARYTQGSIERSWFVILEAAEVAATQTQGDTIAPLKIQFSEISAGVTVTARALLEQKLLTMGYCESLLNQTTLDAAGQAHLAQYGEQIRDALATRHNSVVTMEMASLAAWLQSLDTALAAVTASLVDSVNNFAACHKALVAEYPILLAEDESGRAYLNRMSAYQQACLNSLIGHVLREQEYVDNLIQGQGDIVWEASNQRIAVTDKTDPRRAEYSAALRTQFATLGIHELRRIFLENALSSTTINMTEDTVWDVVAAQQQQTRAEDDSKSDDAQPQKNLVTYLMDMQGHQGSAVLKLSVFQQNAHKLINDHADAKNASAYLDLLETAVANGQWAEQSLVEQLTTLAKQEQSEESPLDIAMVDLIGQMQHEDALRRPAFEGYQTLVGIRRKLVEAKTQVKEQGSALQAKDTALQAKDTALQAKDTALQAKDAEIAALRASIAQLKQGSEPAPSSPRAGNRFFTNGSGH